MSIVTPEEVWDLSGMKGNIAENQDDIERLIPSVENWLCSWKNMYFHARNWVSNTDMVFASAGTITDDNGEFLDADVGFRDGMSFHIVGSVRNDGIYAAETVTATVITLQNRYIDAWGFVDEDFTPAPLVTIFEVHWPKELKFAVAKAIEYDLGKTRGVVEAPARQNPGDTDKMHRYPKRILEMFGPRALC